MTDLLKQLEEKGKLSDKIPKKGDSNDLNNLTENSEKMIEQILENTDNDMYWIHQMIIDKKEELKGLLTTEGALFVISKELGVEVSKGSDKQEDIFGDSPKPKEPFAKEFINKMDKAKLSEELGMKNPNLKKIVDGEDVFGTVKEAPKIPSKQEITNKQNKLNPNPIQTEPIMHPIQIRKEISEAYPVNIEEKKQTLLDAIELYNFTISSIVKDSDYQTINTREGPKKFPKKSAVKKLMLAFNISTKIDQQNSRFWQDESEQWHALYTVIATMLNGRTTEEIGLCSQFEKGRTRSLHDTIATAKTRAESRAVLNLVGMGAVSATEMDDTTKDLFS